MILDLRPDELLGAVGWRMTPETVPGVRCSIYERPKPGRQYVIGADFALGIRGRDKDAFCVLDNTDARKVQVAEVEATLGELADKMLYGLAMFYGGAFIVGERQFGLPSLRRLLKDFGYGWLYYERDEAKRTRPVSDKLGYWKAGNWTSDPALRSLRVAIRQRDIEIRSKPLLDQLGKLQFRSKTTINPEHAHDADMQVKLSGGGSPDLVMGLAYAYHGCHEVDNFPVVKPRYAAGTAGDILGHGSIFEEAEPSPYRGGTPLSRRAQLITRIGDRR
jgi:hypothetical protein